MAGARVMVVAAFACAAGGTRSSGCGDAARTGSAAAVTPAPVVDVWSAAPAAAAAPAAPAAPAAAPAADPAATAEATGALASLDAGPGAEPVVATWRPKAGTSATVRFDAKLDLDLDFGGMQITSTSTQIKRKKVEILGVEPDGTIRKRITYLQRDTHIILDGEERKDPSLVRGKTFLVTWRDGILDVRHPGGAAATPEEVAAVRAEEIQLQVPELLGRALSGLRLVKDQPFEVPVVAFAKLLGHDYRARRLVLTYRGKTRDGARLDADGSLTSDGKGTKQFIDLKAQFVIDPGGWCRSAKVDGQVRVEYNGTVVGSGAGTGVVTATALR